MAPWGSLKNIFKIPSPDPPSPWPQLLPASPKTEISFDIFGEICHQAKPDPSSSSYPPPPAPAPCGPRPRLDKSSSWNGTAPDIDENAFEIFGELCYKTAASEDGQAPEGQPPAEPADGDGTENECATRRKIIYARSLSDARSRYGDGSFPPPLTTIARCGKPRVYFKSYRQDGRFVLREIRIPTQRLLHTRREDGRLRMQVVGPMETERRGGRNDGDDGGEER